MKQFSFYFYRIVVAVFFCVSIPSYIHAATISLIPNSVTVTAGNIVNVSVSVNSQGQAINNSDAIIQFPTDLLQVVNVDTSNSIFNLWVESPGFSNALGQVTFNGGAPNPGFTGTNGKIISITFLAKKTGTASLLFGDSSVRANDGLGTNVLNTKNTAKIIVAPSATQIEPPPPIDTQTVSTQSSITSSTHPNQNKWYNRTLVSLSWNLPQGVKSTQTLLGQYPDSIPTVLYTPAISSKEITKLDDGVWYFHMRNQTESGWSKVSHYRLQVDTVDPYNLMVTTSVDSDNQTNISMSAQDARSGLDYFTVQIDQGQTIVVKADSKGSATSTVASLDTGSHTVRVHAYDKAGNSIEKTTSIQGSTLQSIAITDFPVKMKVGEHITLRGISSLINTDLVASFAQANSKIETFIVKTDEKGNFTFTSSPVSESGNTVVWIDAVNSEGKSFASSNKVSIQVTKPLLIQIGTYTTQFISVAIPLVALLLVLIYMIYYAFHKFYRVKHHFKKDLEVAQRKIHTAFKTLSEEATEQLLKFEGDTKNRKVTLKEQKAIDDLRDAVQQVDEYIQKIVEDIKKTDL